MKKIMWCLFFYLLQAQNVYAVDTETEVVNGLCAPKTADEIVRFFKTGMCGTFSGMKTKGVDFSGKKKGIGIKQDRAGIFFEFDSSTIESQFNAQLREWGIALERLSGSNFIVAGHTDNIGSKQYNDQLSLQRAQTVQRFLINNFKIGNHQLLVEGYGFSKPLKGTATHQTDSERSMNRRVEVVLIR